MLYFSIAIILAYLNAEAGSSLPWSSAWQDIKSWFSEIPEALISLIIGTIAVFGYCILAGMSPWWTLLMFPLPSLITYAGQQSATWAYLTWEGHKNPNTDRDSTLKEINDVFAGLLGFKLGDEGYSWVWAATKGFIITLPIGGTGIITFPLGHELGSHAKGRLPGDPNMWKELVSRLGLGLSCILWILIIL